jgi:hypothetical protein
MTRGMMLVVVLAVSARSAEAGPWSLTVPTGWTDVSGEVPEMRAQLEQLKANASVELHVYVNGDVGQLNVLYTAMKRPYDGHGIVNWEAGFRDSLTKRAGTKEVAYAGREDDTLRIIDAVYDTGGTTSYVKAFAGVDRSNHMRSLTAICTAPKAVCASLSSSLVLDRSELRPLASRTSSVDESSPEYKLGRQIGMLAIIAVAAAVVLSLVLRKRRRRSSRVA